jgi:hypothetical protein
MSAFAGARASALARRKSILDRLAGQCPLEGWEVERVVDVTPQGTVIVETVRGLLRTLSGVEAQRLGIELASI